MNCENPLHVTRGQMDLYSKLCDLYTHMNQYINLVSRRTVDDLYTNHVLHSLCVAKFFNFSSHDIVFDVGTGGGFPGIPLAIYFPDTQFVLIDSIHKKINSVNRIISELLLGNVVTVCARVEDIHDKCDFVLGRAVANINKFISETKHLVSCRNFYNGIIYLNGSGDNPLCRHTVCDIGDMFGGLFVGKQLLYINRSAICQ